MKLIRESLNEASKSPINYNKLVEYAKGIAICCAGEYGDVYYNEEKNEVFVNLGDSHPFEESYLENFMKEAICNGWENQKLVTITIENECGPQNGEGWKKVN
jgi:hypothetical protein